jgi:hypothetical protein
VEHEWYWLSADTRSSGPVALVSGIGSLPIHIADYNRPPIVIYRLVVDTVGISNHECLISMLLEFGPTMSVELYQLPADTSRCR